MRTARSIVDRNPSPFAAVLVLLGGIGIEGVAHAGGSDEREQCATSAEQAQQLRDEGKYRRAREQMLFCARASCPGPIKADCGKWLGELDRDAPTVVFGARDSSGADAIDVRVSMDGVLVQERLDGKPVFVDSGEHAFKFETKTGAVKEERVLVRTGEKARSIVVSFAPLAPIRPHETPAAPTPTPRPVESQGSLVPALVVGGLGVVALGSFAFFGLRGMSDYDALQKCKPNCAKNDVDSTRTELNVADVSAIVGVVALGVATYLFVTRSKVDAPAAHARVPPTPKTSVAWIRVDAAPTVGGGVAVLTGVF